MERHSLDAVARRWMRFWQGAGLAAFETVHAPTFVDHSPSGRGADRAGFRQGIIDLYRVFPDFMATIDLLAIDEEQNFVTIKWSATGHHRDDFLGAPPTGRRVTFTGIEIIRVRGEQVIARWGEWAEAAIRAQLGIS